MKAFFQILICILMLFQVACAQTVLTDRPHCSDPVFDEQVADYIRFTVPVIGVEELSANPQAYHIFDTRQLVEFNTSHIPGAKYLGYKDFDASRLKNLAPDDPIVLYCSIGFRSEKIGEKLQKLGYTNVYNLYGSIFEWINRGCPVEDEAGEKTKAVHTYNRAWSKWVDKEQAVSVW